MKSARALLLAMSLFAGFACLPLDAQSVGSEFQINTYTTNFQGYAAVAMSSSGDFVVVWQSAADGALFGISGQRYDASGAPLASEFQVNTHTTGTQAKPTVAWDFAEGPAPG
jgi:hypothetical protein